MRLDMPQVHTQPLVEASEEPRVQPDVALWRQVTVRSRRTSPNNGRFVQPVCSWQQSSTSGDSIYRVLQAALRMTPAQKQHARDLHTYYWKRMRDIMSERHQLSLAMAVRTSGTLCTKSTACLHVKFLGS